MRPTLLALSVATLAAGCASTPPEADPVQLKLNDLDARITRIERIVANQVEAAQHLDEVQSNVRQLRGRLEELEHSNEALAKQQRDLYADLDKRLAAAGGAAAGNASGEAAAVGGAAKLLGWRAAHSSLEEILSSAWRWHQAHPQGYRGG